MSDRLINSTESEYDAINSNLVPNALSEFVGQSALKSNLSLFISASRARKEMLDHVVFYGPPGLGKTTLAKIVAIEMKGGFKSISAPIITKIGDLIAVMTGLKEGDVLFIDEVHRLPAAVEEILYSAMDNFKVDVMLGEGPSARSIKISLSRFTLVAATTRFSLLTKPLRDRFGISFKLNLYNNQELSDIIHRNATLLSTKMSREITLEIAKRSRGTPRIAIRLMRRVRDYADVHGGTIDTSFAIKALTSIGIDKMGLDLFDLRYLEFLHSNNCPVGISTIAAALADDRNNIENLIEPYLIQEGLMIKTSRGRILTKKGTEHIELSQLAQLQSSSNEK